MHSGKIRETITKQTLSQKSSDIDFVFFNSHHSKIINSSYLNANQNAKNLGSLNLLQRIQCSKRPP